MARPYVDFGDVPEYAVVALPETAEAAIIEAKTAQFLGECVATQTVTVEYLAERPIHSLHEAILRAAEGDPAARNVTRTNVRTDVIERTMKSGHVTTVTLQAGDNGVIHQDGHSLPSIQANNLLFASGNELMRERSEAEAHNSFWIPYLYERGEFADKSLVVVSRAADNMTHAQMEEVGFFTDTMSTSIQVVRMEDRQLVMESAFVAGVARPGGVRHDADTVAAMGDALGVDLRDKTAAETIDTPLLIPNALIPNGVVDLVKLYDECAGEDIFFGESKPKQDYVMYRQACLERESKLDPIVEDIVDELIDQASHIADEVAACQLLNELSQKYMVVQAVNDEAINPRVFGETAARSIEEARFYMHMGQEQQAIQAVTSAQATAVSSSCPSAQKAANLVNNMRAGEAGEHTDDIDSDSRGSLVFSCKNGHLNRRPRGRLIDNCRVCGDSVSC